MKEHSMDKKIFMNEEFKLEYPSSWTVDTSKSWGPELILFSPLENAEDKFSENVNVLVQDLAGHGVDLELYKEMTDQQIATLATDGKILESAIVKNAEKEFYRITYTMTQGLFQLKITSLCFIHNDKAFLVTFTSEVDQYENYKVTGEEILGSFALIR